MNPIFTDYIDLKQYLEPQTRTRISELYSLVGWQFEPPDAWRWKFEDVCALYFRVEAHADHFARDAVAPGLVLKAIRGAIFDFMSDELS